MILLFIVWCLCRAAALADERAQKLLEKGGTGNCIL